ncbi:hypothetical protein ccbrp13_35650 [Ktedonobacteria bacterium brp13]|nr:hypothetical protein ccbrp13_35650 [Ktedonobacteria bacterium brp13]
MNKLQSDQLSNCYVKRVLRAYKSSINAIDTSIIERREDSAIVKPGNGEGSMICFEEGEGDASFVCDGLNSR